MTFFTRYWPYFLAAVSVVSLIAAKGFPIVREWFGFKKEVLETKKTELEIKEMEEKRSSRIQIASFADVRRFDPKVKAAIFRGELHPNLDGPGGIRGLLWDIQFKYMSFSRRKKAALFFVATASILLLGYFVWRLTH
jgi:hypothetical protein